MTRRRFAIVTAALSTAGALPRAFRLDARPFWLDESATFLSVQHLFARTPDSPLFVQATNLLYYALLWGWTQVFGESETAYRSLSAVAATACIPVAAVCGRRIGGSATGIVCALLVAVAPLHIHYAREARAYAFWTLMLWLLLATLYSACAAPAADARTDVRRWLRAGVAWLGALGAHIFSVWLLLPSAAALCWSPRPRRALAGWSAAAAATAAAAAALWLGPLAPVQARGAGSWIAESWNPWTSLPASLWALWPAGASPAHLGAVSLASAAAQPTPLRQLGWIAALVPLAVVVPALVALARAPRVRTRDWRPLAAMALGPLLLMELVSWVAFPVAVPGRYDLVAWPALTLWIALALARMAPRRRALACAVLVLCALPPLGRELANEGGERWNERRARALATLAGPDDLVISFSTDADELAYPLARAGASVHVRSHPSWLEAQIAWVDSRADLSPARSADIEREALARLREMRATLDAGRRVFWLADSLHRERVGARARIAQHLEAGLARIGARRVAVDEPLGIFRIVRTLDSAGAARAPRAPGAPRGEGAPGEAMRAPPASRP